MSEPLPRFVAIGASNLRRGFPEFIDVATAIAGQPVELLAAMGHGRSYGRRSAVLLKSMPGISRCGLWDALSAAPPAPTRALVTDIGNDLLYGEPTDRILQWVQTCVEHLLTANAETTITELPLSNLRRLGVIRYRCFRTLFFPPCRLTLAEITQRAYALNDGLRRMAALYGVRLLAPQDSWYGFDPIHIRRQKITHAWEFFFGMNDPSRTVSHPSANMPTRRARSLVNRASIQLAAPASERLLGRERNHDQPALTLSSGTRVSVY